MVDFRMGIHCHAPVDFISRLLVFMFIVKRYYLLDKNTMPITEHRYSSTSHEPQNVSLVFCCKYNGRCTQPVRFQTRALFFISFLFFMTYVKSYVCDHDDEAVNIQRKKLNC